MNRKIKSYKSYNEGMKEILLGITAFLSVGLSKGDAQEIKNDQPKLAVISALDSANKANRSVLREFDKRSIDFDKVKPFLIEKKTKEGIKHYLDKAFISAPINGLYKYDVNINKNWKIQGSFNGTGVLPAVSLTYKIAF